MNARNELPLFDEVNNELARLELFTHGSESHGAICGYLCANMGEDFTFWFNNILLRMSDEALGDDEEASHVHASEAQLINTLFAASAEQLEDEQYAMRLLLPDDDEPLSDRVDALAEWCHGFLYGLTIAAGKQLSHYSADAQEVISDFVKISQGGLEGGDDQEDDETAFAEIVEYVRVGALLIWADSRQFIQDEGAPTLH